MRILPALFSLLALGCHNINYKPDVTLGLSPVTIEADVQFNGIVDRAPETDRELGFFDDVSATGTDSLDGDLGLGVTNAVLRDFRDNQVFRRIAKRLADPDLILEGRIVRYTGKSGLSTIGVITAPLHYLFGLVVWYLDVWYLGFSIQETLGVIEMELTLRKPDGPVVGTYSANRSFEWSHSYYYSEWAIDSLPRQMNQILGEVVQEIRDGMVGDRQKLEGR